jgi:hypothetical protein
MSKAKINKMQCPACSADIVYSKENPFRPFCSERCKNLDFTQWADEGHRITGSSEYDDILSEDLEK